MATLISAIRGTQTSACVKALALTDSNGGDDTVKEDGYGSGIYKATGTNISFYWDIAGVYSARIKEFYAYSTVDTDVKVFIEKSIINNSTWKKLGIAFSGDTDQYLDFNNTPDETNPVEVQDWNQVPVDIACYGTPLRFRFEADTTTTIYMQALEV